MYKALTGTYKYLQRQAFAIPTGDNPEKDRRKPRESAQQKRKRQAKHDDAWDKERAWFHAAIRGHLWDHDTLWAECERGKGSIFGKKVSNPSAWGSKKRHEFVQGLATGTFNLGPLDPPASPVRTDGS